MAPAAADALRLPFADAAFDGATVGFGVRNLMDLDAGLREAARVLKPGARFVVLEFTTPRWQPFRAMYLAYLRQVLPRVGRMVSKHRSAYDWLPASVLRVSRAGRARRRACRAPDSAPVDMADAAGWHRRDSHRDPDGSMSLDSLPDFIAAIERIGELVRVREPVRTHLEIAEIADRVMKSPGGGPALLFEQPVLPDGATSAMPVAINLFGSRGGSASRSASNGSTSIGDRIAEMMNLKVPEGLLGKARHAAAGSPSWRSSRRSMRSGRPACQEVVWRGDDIDLDAIPLLQTWPEDGGRYITLPMVITRDPVERRAQRRACIACRCSGKRDLAMHWQRHKSRRGALARDGRARREDAGGDRHRRRSGEHLFRFGAAAAGDRRVSLCRLHPREARRAGEGA